MRTLIRLIFAILALFNAVVASMGLAQSASQTLGQQLMVWSLVPSTLFCLTVSVSLWKTEHEQKAASFVIFFAGMFLCLLMLGMWKQTESGFYLFVAGLGIMLIIISTRLMTQAFARPQCLNT